MCHFLRFCATHARKLTSALLMGMLAKTTSWIRDDKLAGSALCRSGDAAYPLKYGDGTAVDLTAGTALLRLPGRQQRLVQHDIGIGRLKHVHDGGITAPLSAASGKLSLPWDGILGLSMAPPFGGRVVHRPCRPDGAGDAGQGAAAIQAKSAGRKSARSGGGGASTDADARAKWLAATRSLAAAAVKQAAMTFRLPLPQGGGAAAPVPFAERIVAAAGTSAAGGAKPRVMGFSLRAAAAASAPAAPASFMTIGSINPARYTGEIAWLRTLTIEDRQRVGQPRKPRLFSFRVDGISIGGATAASSAERADKRAATTGIGKGNGRLGRTMVKSPAPASNFVNTAAAESLLGAYRTVVESLA
jgi:hypothetical protein